MLFISLLFSIIITSLTADFYPSSITSEVKAFNGHKIILTKPLSHKGMSGIVIHNFGSELKAISNYIRYEGGNNATTIGFEPIVHQELPTVKPKVRAKDKVIGGYLYKNILLLAPDYNTYKRITSSAKKNWIHPDLYAMFLSKIGDQIPTKFNLLKFASEYQIGLIYIVQRGKGVLYDPVSARYISSTELSGLPIKGQFPFYMRLGKIDSGWFSRDAKGTYYNTVGNLR
ncbi:MAG: plasminogen-binding N-terminal domain-containing protein [Sulfurovum sp.]|nr:plasminogen-binding N-terminal domain-containing protein [Sulfurovaceae bacterium]